MQAPAGDNALRENFVTCKNPRRPDAPVREPSNARRGFQGGHGAEKFDLKGHGFKPCRHRPHATSGPAGNQLRAGVSEALILIGLEGSAEQAAEECCLARKDQTPGAKAGPMFTDLRYA